MPARKLPQAPVQEVEQIIELAQEQAAVQEEVVEEQKFFNEKGEEILFPEGPTMREIEEFKRRWGSVYLTDFDNGEVYIYRALTRKEWRDIKGIQNADQFYQEERICDCAVVWPKVDPQKWRNFGSAGIPSAIAEQVLEKSGFMPNIV